MTTLSPPPQTRTIGTALIAGKPVPVQADIAWFRYWAQGVYDRIGGATGASSAELAALIAAITEGHAIEDEGSALTQRATLNFTGAGVTVSDVGGKTVVSVAGGGGNSVAVAIDFGAAFTDKAQSVVTGQTWVTAGSEIVGQILTPSGTDPDEMRLLDMQVVISDIVAGDGFTVTVYSETEAKGVYTVACIGV